MRKSPKNLPEGAPSGYSPLGGRSRSPCGTAATPSKWCLRSPSFLGNGAKAPWGRLCKGRQPLRTPILRAVTLGEIVQGRQPLQDPCGGPPSGRLYRGESPYEPRFCGGPHPGRLYRGGSPYLSLAGAPPCTRVTFSPMRKSPKNLPEGAPSGYSPLGGRSRSPCGTAATPSKWCLRSPSFLGNGAKAPWGRLCKGRQPLRTPILRAVTLGEIVQGRQPLQDPCGGPPSGRLYRGESPYEPRFCGGPHPGRLYRGGSPYLSLAGAPPCTRVTFSPMRKSPKNLPEGYPLWVLPLGGIIIPPRRTRRRSPQKGASR